MNKLILCEGKTDAILLSYYLEKVAGWKYTTKSPSGLKFKKSNENESVDWYRKDQDCLLICGVGGNSNFGKFFINRIKAPQVMTDAFEKIVIITDRDDRAEDEICTSLLEDTSHFFQNIKNRQWCKNTYQNDFKMQKELQLLLLVIPTEHAGALENVMLDAIAEDAYDKNIVDKTEVFVKQMRKEAAKYISSNRLQLKAHLGVTWAIQYPEKVFSVINEQIKSVRWEQSETLEQCFGMLREL